jgi:hypothetical protein
MRNLPLVALLAALVGPPALAAAQAEEGRKLVEQHKCENCHHNKTLGDAKAIYLRKDRRVTTLEKLKAQVSACNSELNIGLFPEDEEHVVAFLDETYYKFTSSRPPSPSEGRSRTR